MPKPVEKPRPPKDYASSDELYFTGQRIEQLYSPSFEAAPYYQEMLRRDPGDYRANTAMGILLCRQWRWDEAAQFLSNALARATANYIQPKDVEAWYYLGVALKANGELAQARDAFEKAVWNPAWQAPGHYALAEIACQNGLFQEARDHAERSFRSGGGVSAAGLCAAICRRLGDKEASHRWAELALQNDPLDLLAQDVIAQSTQLGRLLKGKPDSCLELAAIYQRAGLWEEALQAMQHFSKLSAGLPHSEMLRDHMAYYQLRSKPLDAGDIASTNELPGFPFQWESIPVLEKALKHPQQAPHAAYQLGCLLYDNQPENAIKAWEEARRRDDKFALTHRNLGLAYAQFEKNIPKAIASLEKAIELNPTEARFYYELDAQYEAVGTPVAKRLEMLTKHHDTVAKRDDSITREIELLTVTGRADRALELLLGQHFRNWEGRSQIHGVYVDACLTQGLKLVADKKPREALAAYKAALEYPENLEVGRPPNSPRTAQIQFLIGTAHESLGDAASARAAFEQAVKDSATAKVASERALAGRGDSEYESDYFGARALLKLGRTDEAKPIFERLIKTGEEQLAKGDGPDYFAKFGEKTSERVRQANAHYLIGLGQLGLDEKEKASAAFQQALELDPAHLGAREQSRATVAQ